MPFPASPTDNRFALVTPDNNSAPLIIVTILSFIFAFLIFAVRIFIVKWKRHGYDDGVLALAHITAVGHWVAMFVALHSGLGKALSLITKHDQDVMAKAAFAGRTLLIPTLCLSKISVLLVLRHLFHYERRRKLLIIDLSMLAVAVWGFAATIVLSTGCSPNYLLGDGQCSSNAGRIRGVMITEIITEAVIIVLSPLFLYSFDIALKTKLLVMSAFSFRLPLIPLSTLYLLTQTHYLEHPSASPNTVSAVPSLLYQEILISYALMSATIPCLKSFVEGFTTGGVGYVTDPNAGRVPTVTTNDSEGSYELRKVVAQAAEEDVGLGRVNEEGTRRSSRRISERLSRVWNGPEVARVVNSQASNQPMMKPEGERQRASV